MNIFRNKSKKRILKNNVISSYSEGGKIVFFEKIVEILKSNIKGELIIIDPENSKTDIDLKK